MSELDVLIEGELIGRVRMNKTGRLSFDYKPHWRDSPNGHSLSVSMPLANITYSHNQVWQTSSQEHLARCRLLRNT